MNIDAIKTIITKIEHDDPTSASATELRIVIDWPKDPPKPSPLPWGYNKVHDDRYTDITDAHGSVIGRFFRVMPGTVGGKADYPHFLNASLAVDATNQHDRWTAALEAARDWHDAERKTLGKIPLSGDVLAWRRMQHLEQSNAITDALNGKDPTS